MRGYFCFHHVCNVLVPHEFVEHGHDVHGHGATVSSGHEHRREEEGEGTYSISVEKWQQVVDLKC